MKPTLISEVDFEGNPTATYHDTVRYDDDTVAYWRMNDNSALTDELGVNDGTVTSAPAEDPSLLDLDADLALTFDGVADYASVPSSTSLTSALTGSWSVHGMVEVQTVPGSTKVLWTKGSVQLLLLSSGKLRFRVMNHVSGVSTVTTVTSTTAFAAGEKHHVICVHDADSDELRLYVDGLPETTVAHSVGTELWSLPWLFGAGHSGTSPAFGSVGTLMEKGGGGPSDTWVVAAPASIAVGDLLLAHFYTSSNGAPGGSWTLPSGWTALYVDTAATTDMLMIAYKIAAAGDVGAASYTFVKTGTNATLTLGIAAISRFTGVDTTQPFANPIYVAADGFTASTGNIYGQSNDVLALGLAQMNRRVAWTSSDGTEQYDLGGANSPGKSIAMYTASHADQDTASKFDMASNGTAGIATAAWVALKGPDAQDFANVTLDEWAVSARAFSDDEALDLSEARASGDGTLTDMTSASRALTITRARQYELDRFEAGTLAENLKDEARNFDPANTEGDYYPHVKTKRRVRRSAQVGPDTLKIGTTSVGGSWNTQSADFKEAYKKTASEPFVPGSISAYLRGLSGGPQALRFLLYADNAGVPGALIAASDEVVIAADQAEGWVEFPLPFGLPRQPAGDYWVAVWAGGTTDQSQMAYVAGAGNITYFNADAYDSTADPDDPFGSATLASARNASVYVTAVGGTFPRFEGYVERWVPKYLAPAYQEASISAVDGMALLALAPLSGTLPSGLSGAQIHRLLDIARWPRDKRAIDAGQFLMDSWVLEGKALAAIQTIADSELGQFFIDANGVATFHDYAHRWTDTRSRNVQAIFSDVQADVDAGAIRYLFGGIVPSFDDDTTINQWTVSTSSGTSVTIKDVVGARSAFPLANERSTRLVSITDAETQARALLQHTARAGQRFDTLTVSPDDETRWAAVLGLDVSDLVRVVRTPAVGSPMVQDCFVEGVEDDTPDSEDWVVRFSLSPVSPASFYETAVRSEPVSYYRLNEAT